MQLREFKVAMFNRLTVGPYERPDAVAGADTEWLIVERSGPMGGYLQISEAVSAHPVSDGPAPDDLEPLSTILAVATETSADRARFLMLRHAPAGIELAGSFFPADGYAEVARSGRGLRLHAVGRHFHRTEVIDGRPVLIDVSDPSSGTGTGSNWHFHAESRDWSGEV